MNPVYETKDFEVSQLYDSTFEVTHHGVHFRLCLSLPEARELADLIQGDLDEERARERWDAERGNEP